MSRIFVAVGIASGQKVGVVYNSDDDDVCELCSSNRRSTCEPEHADLCGCDGYLVKLEGEDLDEKEAAQLMLLGEKVKTPSMSDDEYCAYRIGSGVNPFQYVSKHRVSTMMGLWGKEVYRVVIEEEPTHTITIDGTDIELSAESYKKLKESLCPES